MTSFPGEPAAGHRKIAQAPVAELGPLGQLTGSHEGQDRLLTH